MRPSPAAHAMRGAARAATHAHDRWARGLGRGALTALRITIPPCTTAAPAGGAHAGGVCAGAPWRLLVESSSRMDVTVGSLHACFALGWVRGGRGVAAFPARAPKDAPRAGYAPPGGPRGYNPPRDGMAQVIRPRSWNCGHGVKLSRLMTRNSSRRSRKSATGVVAVCASCAVAARWCGRPYCIHTGHMGPATMWASGAQRRSKQPFYVDIRLG